MSDYIPTTEEIRWKWSMTVAFDHQETLNARQELQDRFDRWLEQHDKEVRQDHLAVLWERFYEAVINSSNSNDDPVDSCPVCSMDFLPFLYCPNDHRSFTKGSSAK